ncbi:MAG: hypothetical protein AAGK05_02770, partial [Pseudomonadota bacterium]
RDQFFALNDSLAIMARRTEIECTLEYVPPTPTDFPLGDNMWFYCDDHIAKIYTVNRNKQPYFTFQSLSQYKTFTHRRILSLLRLKDNAKDGSSSTTWSFRRPTAGNKRPLSTIVQPNNQSATAKRSHQSGEAISRATNDALVSNSKQKSAILPKRDDTTSRRRSDSFSSLSSVSEDLLFPEEEQSLSYMADDSMESE